MRIVVPFGFYGFGNIGDEATLQGFAGLLAHTQRRLRVSIASQDPAHTGRVEPAFRYFRASGTDPMRWWAKARASAHLFVGGTPIMDVLGKWPLSEVCALVRTTEKWKLPVSFIGVGVEGLRAEESRRVVAAELLPRVRHWSVRSAHDRQRLVDYGASQDKVTVAADMAWLIEPATSEFGAQALASWGVDRQRPLIGVNLVNENLAFDREPQLVDALASALDETVARVDGRVLFLSNEVREDPAFDKAAAMHVMAKMRNRDRAVLAPNVYFSPRQMMSIISCCTMTMSMRYHFCLFSALQRVPFIAIKRSDKVADLCADLGWTATVAMSGLEASAIIDQASTLQTNSPARLAHMASRVRDMKERALINVIALDALHEATSRRDH